MMARDPILPIQTYNNIYRVGQNGGYVNTNGMNHTQKIAVENAVRDGRNNNYKP
jgi:hypothetical protein